MVVHVGNVTTTTTTTTTATTTTTTGSWLAITNNCVTPASITSPHPVPSDLRVTNVSYMVAA